LQITHQNPQASKDLKLIHHFYDDEAFIDAFANRGREHNFDDFDHVLFSYHGLPARQIIKADLTKKHCLQSKDCCAQITSNNQHCYKAQCYATTNAIAKKLDLPKEKYTTTFQSRLGKEIWLEPYTVEVIPQLAKEGKKKLLIFSPAFVADCLETLYEIQVEYLELFREFGGEQITLVKSLNAGDDWAKAVSKIVLK